METLLSYITMPVEYLKKLVFEKWIGRAILFGLATLSGWMANTSLDPALVKNWIDATAALAEPAAVLAVGWILALIRHKVALNMPVK
jgi:hypothetical protein